MSGVGSYNVITVLMDVHKILKENLRHPAVFTCSTQTIFMYLQLLLHTCYRRLSGKYTRLCRRNRNFICDSLGRSSSLNSDDVETYGREEGGEWAVSK
eukprot:764014-Hanusia_phi.AAC.2